MVFLTVAGKGYKDCVGGCLHIRDIKFPEFLKTGVGGGNERRNKWVFSSKKMEIWQTVKIYSVLIFISNLNTLLR